MLNASCRQGGGVPRCRSSIPYPSGQVFAKYAVSSEEGKSMAEKAPELRKYPRAVVSLAVKYSREGNTETARALNLSATGLLIETKAPLPLSERLKVAFKVPGAEEVIQADAEVVWVNKYSADYPCGMAVKFVGLPDKTIQTIDAYVRKVRESVRPSQREDLAAIPD